MRNLRDTKESSPHMQNLSSSQILIPASLWFNELCSLPHFYFLLSYEITDIQGSTEGLKYLCLNYRLIMISSTKLIESWRTPTFELQNLLQSYSDVIKKVWSWPNSRYIDQWNRIETLHIYGSLLFNKSTKTIQWGNNRIFSKEYWDN